MRSDIYVAILDTELAPGRPIEAALSEGRGEPMLTQWMGRRLSSSGTDYHVETRKGRRHCTGLAKKLMCPGTRESTQVDLATHHGAQLENHRAGLRPHSSIRHCLVASHTRERCDGGLTSRMRGLKKTRRARDEWRSGARWGRPSWGERTI